MRPFTNNQQKKNNYLNIPIKKEIENFIYIIIDMKKIIKKMKTPLDKNSRHEVYYLLNFNLFLEYMNFFNLNNLYTNPIINQTIENIINNSEIELLNGDIFINAKSNQEFLSVVNNYSNNIRANNFHPSTKFTPNRIDTNVLSYFENFILISESTKKSLLNNNNNQNILYFYCYFGESKVFACVYGSNQYLIEVYYLEQNQYKLLPEAFFKFNNIDYLNGTTSLLKEKGYYQLVQQHIMFNNDFTSPIFDKSNKEMGYAYKYVPNLKDYTPYIINKEYKTMIRLFFHYIKLHSKSIMYKSGNPYLLINSKYMKRYKDYYEYLKLETDLANDKIVLQAVNNINENYDYIVNDKMMTLIIKNLPKEYNQKFIGKSQSKVQTTGIELIDKDLYTSLFKKNNLGNFCTCYFINNDICIKMPKSLNTKSAIYIYGYLHSQQNFKANYLLEYNTENDFINNYNFANQTGGFDKYITSFKFINTSTEQLIDMNNRPLGIIYKLNSNFIPNPVPYPKPPVKPDPIPVPIPINPNQPPLIGLQNVGATCYMNATLQCFSQIQELEYNFKNNPQVFNTIAKYKQMNKDCLTESFKILIDNLWPLNYNSNHSKNGSNYYYAPYDFKNKISVMNPLFKGAQANDAKDLVNFIIMTMHEELNIGQKQNNMNMNLQAYQTNEQMMLNCFMNIFYTENKSIISDIFYGMTHTLTKCSNCPFYKHNFEAYFFLIFPLEEVRKYKIEELSNRNILLNQNMMMINQNMNNFNMDQNMMMNYNQMQIEYNNNIAKLPLLQNNLLTIEDCFDYNQKIENFVGENAMYCDICKMQLPSTFQTKLYNAPEVLILILNRGQGIQFKIKLEF